ncbi:MULTISPECIES: pyrroloquinoline quinone-dependent dehydrogenase [unclassified Limnobacter]|jgi:alcohol dehydrogenase (cytochrome c)|uniref:pyrroloquinoline quinone-dependent dehydrogenase n=1 Tax=unclassified Limnobacter TaxID=2630203 RepID=UPI000C3F20A1|nr:MULTISPECIES: PQQ-binding-like beta-propeller repeat protein [unclassified Limnobacter]MAG82028.1 pyrrolo-quinoline quinone [Sutterellaceae bacterium]MBT84801.1 pyrrolo-quinoline quinone [Sutterellaceae bacterium]MDP3270836.1 PQQ-binding-like beta-propeller repeat protein [Limnobacter sp.]|tara:strand:- start:10642 stop:12414 length:1773 start_codon:yes stop_codon:yes gene_type:complete
MTLHQALAAAFSLLVCTATFASSGKEWPVFGGNWDHQRHSQSTQITPGNVGQLDLAWEFDTGVSSSFQATPIVVNGVMFVSLPFNHVVALKADTGKLLWRYTHNRIKDRPMCCGPANRGVAVSDGKVFMGTVDSRLLALDARTGQKLWDIDVTKGEQGVQEDAATLGSQLDTQGGKLEVSGASGAGINMAPMVFDGKVIVGITGVGYGLHLDSPDPDAPLGAVVGIAGNYGRRGFMAAYDVNTGAMAWKFDTVPDQGWEGEFTKATLDGVVLPRNIEEEKAKAAQYPDAWKFGGGSAWSTPAIDRDNGILYFGTGNPSPQMEGSSRPGDNLYTASLVALDVRTGKLKWFYQQVPHDMWGYDVASPPVLFTTRHEGQAVKAVGQAGKTGWFYVHNRITGELLFKSEAFVPQHNMFTLPTEQGNVIYPGVIGGSNWSPVSVDEQRRMVFIAGIHWPVKYQLHELKAKGNKPALRYSSMSPIEDGEKYGLLSAIHLDTGKLVWQHKVNAPLIGGVLSTQTGLVFSGEGSGEFFALDSNTGKRVWQHNNSAGVNAPPIAYEVDEKQFLAVAVGGNKLFGFKQGQTIKAWALRVK